MEGTLGGRGFYRPTLTRVTAGKGDARAVTTRNEL